MRNLCGSMVFKVKAEPDFVVVNRKILQVECANQLIKGVDNTWGRLAYIKGNSAFAGSRNISCYKSSRPCKEIFVSVIPAG